MKTILPPLLRNHLIETGNGEPVIVGRAIMHRGHFVGPDMKIAFDVRNKQACINGTDFYNPGGKWFYCFERVEAVDRTPLNTFVVKNHGRSFCEFHVMNFED